MDSINWVPLESNPEVMNKFLDSLGVPNIWGVSDVFSLDDELLSMIPSPTLAFLLLYPIKEAHEEYNRVKEEECQASGKAFTGKELYFMKQTIRNACGTVALIHSLANNLQHLKLKDSSALLKFVTSTKSLSPEDRGKKLETDEDIGSAHENTALQGQTEAPSADAPVNLHFVAFVNVDNVLYELDGRKAMPISHGSTSEDNFIKDAARVCKDYMQRDPEEMNFTMLALGPSSQ